MNLISVAIVYDVNELLTEFYRVCIYWKKSKIADYLRVGRAAFPMEEYVFVFVIWNDNFFSDPPNAVDSYVFHRVFCTPSLILKLRLLWTPQIRWIHLKMWHAVMGDERNLRVLLRAVQTFVSTPRRSFWNIIRFVCDFFLFIFVVGF